MWDAVPVEWSAWRTARTTLSLHMPLDAVACEECGVLDDPVTALGRRPGSGRLHASRCQHCGLDSVTDLEAGETWTLGPEDYGPDGSHEADVLF